MEKNTDPQFVMSMFVNKEGLYRAKADYYMEKMDKVRKAFKKYVKSEGCGCCEDHEKHQKASTKLGKLLNFKPYPDGSGYDFYERKND